MKKKIAKKEHADPKSALLFKAIRNEYADLGVEDYYRNHAAVYENPHFLYIQQLLAQNRERIDYSRTLDLACGGGEVTLILRGLGFDNSVGCDPFTHALFEQNTGQKCLVLSFEDIVKGALSVLSPNPRGELGGHALSFGELDNHAVSPNPRGELGGHALSHNPRGESLIHPITQSQNHSFTQFSSVISSFAMHLCPEKQLFALVAQLFLVTGNIVIITPHKRPELETLSNVVLLFEDFVLTERGKKVFLKSYIEKIN